MTVFDQYLKWTERENLDIEQISYNDLLLFMKHCRHNGASQRRVQNYIGTIKHLYGHFIREGKTAKNPATDITIKGVKRKTLYHILEPHELHALYNSYPASSIQQSRNRVVLGMMVYQGLKTEELAELEINDINLREGKITVPGGRKSNGREMRLEAHQVMEMYDYVLKVRAGLMEMDTKRKSQAKGATDKLFIGEGGNCYDFSNFIT